ncbi:RAQPRD family integrative conjugative element protein [Pseudomonas aeruginosa]|uniref:RAQPRD family integrative conjugative element protein n=1 Tax=Pseudomonas aeruginosa TaxID=287 RepID=UPI00405438DB
MVASIWLRAAHRGVPTFLVTALLLGQSQMALAESPAQRQELVAALRQLDALERTVADSAAHAPSSRASATTSTTRGCWLTWRAFAPASSFT